MSKKFLILPSCDIGLPISVVIPSPGETLVRDYQLEYEPGTTATVLFTPTQIGEYEFECTIPGHKEAGMVGRVTVTQ